MKIWYGITESQKNQINAATDNNGRHDNTNGGKNRYFYFIGHQVVQVDMQGTGKQKKGEHTHHECHVKINACHDLAQAGLNAEFAQQNNADGKNE